MFAEVMGALFEVGVQLVSARQGEPIPPDPNAERIRATAKSYRLWAASRGLSRDDSRVYRGTIGARRIVLALGLRRQPPGPIRLDVTIRHGEEPKSLRTVDDATSSIQRALVEPLGDSAEIPLRSIDLTDEGIRLTFAPFTDPDVVEQHMLKAVAVLEPSQVATGTAYR